MWIFTHQTLHTDDWITPGQNRFPALIYFAKNVVNHCPVVFGRSSPRLEVGGAGLWFDNKGASLRCYIDKQVLILRSHGNTSFCSCTRCTSNERTYGSIYYIQSRFYISRQYFTSITDALIWTRANKRGRTKHTSVYVPSDRLQTDSEQEKTLRLLAFHTPSPCFGLRLRPILKISVHDTLPINKRGLQTGHPQVTPQHRHSVFLNIDERLIHQFMIIVRAFTPSLYAAPLHPLFIQQCPALGPSHPRGGSFIFVGYNPSPETQLPYIHGLSRCPSLPSVWACTRALTTSCPPPTLLKN